MPESVRRSVRMGSMSMSISTWTWQKRMPRLGASANCSFVQLKPFSKDHHDYEELQCGGILELFIIYYLGGKPDIVTSTSLWLMGRSRALLRHIRYWGLG